MSTMNTQEAPPVDRIRRVEIAVALVATVLVIADYTVFLAHAPGLWRDEINSVNLASTPSVTGMFRLAEFDSFPLLWPLLLRAWMAIAGHGDGALRIAGVAGGLSIVAALWIAAAATGRRAPVVALAIVAVNPEILRWCGTLRAFGPGAAVAALCAIALIRVVESPTRARVLLATAASVASVQLLYQNTVLVAIGVAGAMIAAVVSGHARRAFLPVAIGAAGAVSMLPYLGVVARVREWSPLVETREAPALIFAKLFTVIRAAHPIAVAVSVVFLCAALAGGVRMLVRGAPPERGRAAAGALMALAGPLVFALFLARLHYATVPWYYVGLLVFVALCVDLALRESIRARGLRIATLALACTALAAGSARVWGVMHAPQTIVDKLAATLSQSARPGDLVLVNPWFYALSVDRYYHGPAETVSVPPLKDRSLHRYDLLKLRMTQDDVMAATLDRIGAILRDGGRVWIVGTLRSTPRGRLRRRLPPPPRPETGWNVNPDLAEWATDLGDFIVAHGGFRRLVYEPAPGAPFYESPTLEVVEGWRP